MIESQIQTQAPETLPAQLGTRYAPADTIQRECRVVSLPGLTDYTDALQLQYAAQQAVRKGSLADTLYLLEHRPVITIGRGAGSNDKDLISSRADLEKRSIAIVDADRGGDTTYHGPGQLVGYSLVDLSRYGRDLHRYIRSLEQIVISSLADHSVDATTLPGLTGVWIGGSKIAAIGIKVSRWVSMHGFSINIDADLSVMRRDIVPCGIADKDVVSLRELGSKASREALEASLAWHWSKTLGIAASAPVLHSNISTETSYVASSLSAAGIV